MLPVCIAILCGGAGTRLWPVSRDSAPKQFHALVDERSLLTNTVRRTVGLPDVAATMIVTAEAFVEVAEEHARRGGIASPKVILEPAPRNTAPAAAIAALAAQEYGRDTIVALLPSDHHISNDAGFAAAMEQARALAEQGFIVTLGIVPSAPSTGFGYIKAGDRVGAGFKVAQFVEKPKEDRAREFVASGDYYWNAGLFIFRADVYLAELERFAPAIAQAVGRAWRSADKAGDRVLVAREAWLACPGESIDYAVAEHTALAAVVPVDMGWSDVGSWSALHDMATLDSTGNASSGDVQLTASDNCYVRSTGRHVAVIGAKDLIVVETEDAVLIVHRDSTQLVKAAAEQFKAKPSPPARGPRTT